MSARGFFAMIVFLVNCAGQCFAQLPDDPTRAWLNTLPDSLRNQVMVEASLETMACMRGFVKTYAAIGLGTEAIIADMVKGCTGKFRQLSMAGGVPEKDYRDAVIWMGEDAFRAVLGPPSDEHSVPNTSAPKALIDPCSLPPGLGRPSSGCPKQ